MKLKFGRDALTCYETTIRNLLGATTEERKFLQHIMKADWGMELKLHHLLPRHLVSFKARPL
jgi:hypothetical protein